jgi:hypothetical protein
MYGEQRRASHRCRLLWPHHDVGYDPPVTHGAKSASA